MGDKKKLIEKLTRRPKPTDFTTNELDRLMSQCGCSKHHGGRGSSIYYKDEATGNKLQFDGPHPGNELYPYQIKEVIEFLKFLKEID